MSFILFWKLACAASWTVLTNRARLYAAFRGSVGRPDNGEPRRGTAENRVSFTDTDGLLLYNTGLQSSHSRLRCEDELLLFESPSFFSHREAEKEKERSGGARCCWRRTCTCLRGEAPFVSPPWHILEDGRRRRRRGGLSTATRTTFVTRRAKTHK